GNLIQNGFNSGNSGFGNQVAAQNQQNSFASPGRSGANGGAGSGEFVGTGDPIADLENAIPGVP
ncbi:Hypothetical protein FKW44_022317, partial [Caligus rogercresseyi]